MTSTPRAFACSNTWSVGIHAIEISNQMQARLHRSRQERNPGTLNRTLKSIQSLHVRHPHAPEMPLIVTSRHEFSQDRPARVRAGECHWQCVPRQHRPPGRSG